MKDKAGKTCLRLRFVRLVLLWLAAGNSIFWCSLYLLPWNVLLILYCIFSAATWVQYLISAFAVNGIIIALMKNCSFAVRCASENVRIMRRILSDRSVCKKLKGMAIIKQGDAWEMIDDACFIRVNQKSAAILFADEIDMSAAGIHTVYTLFDDFGKKREYAAKHTFDRYTFKKTNGKRVIIQLDKASLFLQWISEHGGRTVYKSKSERLQV